MLASKNQFGVKFYLMTFSYSLHTKYSLNHMFHYMQNIFSFQLGAYNNLAFREQ